MSRARVAIRLAAIGFAVGTAALHAPAARAQDEAPPIEVVSDSTFEARPRAPLGYATSYDLNVSRGAWVQTLDYSISRHRVAFTTSANLNTVRGVHGLESNGIDGNILGSLNFRATNRWIWTLAGTFNSVSQGDQNSDTDLRQNQLQISTQYTAKPAPQLLLLGSVYLGLQDNQSVGTASVRAPSWALSAATHDSSYTSGHGNGFTGNATWTPAGYMRLYVTASATNLRTTTNSFSDSFYVANRDSAAADSFKAGATPPQQSPNGNQQISSKVTYTGMRRTTAELVIKGQTGDQQYYALNKSAQEHISSQSSSGSFHIDHSPIPGGRLALDVSSGRVSRVYALQTYYTTLVHSQALSAAMGLTRTGTRASLSLDLSRIQNEKQVSQNGTTISRILGAGGMRQISRRLALDGTAGVSLISRTYLDQVSDRDDQRINVNVGGGYLVSRPCSTAVHFSVNRGHTVALSSASSAGNNVQTVYQMDAALRLQVTRALLLVQNYQLNAVYFIYDYEINEAKNTLTRIRRIDTFMIDSLFSGVYLKLNHNFFYQDRGSYTAQGESGSRIYDIVVETYQQNLGLTLGVQPIRGIVFNVTQSLANTRNYDFISNLETVQNRWNLNFGALIDRQLPAGIALSGSIQHIGEYTELPPDAPLGAKPRDVVDYWLAGASLTKDF